MEPGYLNDPTKYSTLSSALALPIEGPTGLAAVLAIYRRGHDAFTAHDLRIAAAIANAAAGAEPNSEIGFVSEA